jgi:hypothetical protein
MRTTSGLIAVGLLLAVGACTSEDSPPPQTPASTQLTVGFGNYGPIKVGMSRADLLAATPVGLKETGGNGSCVFLADSRLADGNPYGYLQVLLKAQQVVGISAPSVAPTDRGVGVGSSFEQLTDAYGDPVEDSTNEVGRFVVFGDASQGWLGFDLDPAGTVREIRTGTDAFARGAHLCADGDS